MKKIVWVLALALCLSGCGEPESFETMSDQYEIPSLPQARETVMWLPEEAAVHVFQPEGELLEFGECTVWAQTLEAGDLDATLRAVTGFPREKLTVIETRVPDGIRYLCAWAAAGEGGDRVGRTLVLDDGSYHYTLSLSAPAEAAGDLALTWADMMASFRLRCDDEEITKG